MRMKKDNNTGALVFRLAWKDLWHELILSICLTMAVTAVLAPIFILFGLKFGSMELLRNRLIEDPRNREVRPTASSNYKQQWFEKLSIREDIAFVIPMTRTISTGVHACVLQEKTGKCLGKGINIDLLPTASEDPLLLENEGVIPSKDQCVISMTAAEKFGAAVGDILELSIKRIVRGRYEKVTLQLKVAAILTHRAGTIPAMFVQLPVLEAVEQYKDGNSVPYYGWKGNNRSAYPQYDGLILWSSSAFSKLEQLQLKSKTGFSDIQEVSKNELTQKTDIIIESKGYLYLLSTRKNTVGPANIQTIAHRLRGKNVQLIPWVKPIKGKVIKGKNVYNVELVTLGYDNKKSAQLSISPAVFWDNLSKKEISESLFALTKERINTKHKPKQKQQVTLQMNLGKKKLSLPLSVYGSLNNQTTRLYIPVELGGILRLSANRPLQFIQKTGQILIDRQGYAGFRLYTKNIDQVSGLSKYFEKKGIEVSTQADRIRDVKELNHYLTLIFWIITAAAAVGGTATLAASLYGSVERKKREIAVLRLLGFSRSSLLTFPLYQGAILTLGGLLIATCFFYSLAALINHLFAHMIRESETLCTLNFIHLAWFSGAILLITVIAATGAAWRITHLELVEALRDE